MRVPVPDRLRSRLVGDVEDPGTAIDHSHIGAVGPLGIDIRVVGSDAGIELRMARRWRCGVALADARHPPAPKLSWLRRVAHVDDPISLVVAGIARLEIRRAAGAMDGLAVDEPDLVHAARMRA